MQDPPRSCGWVGKPSHPHLREQTPNGGCKHPAAHEDARATGDTGCFPLPTAAAVEPARRLGKHSPALADVPARGQAPAARCGTAPGSRRCGLTAQCRVWSTGKLFPGIPASCHSRQAGPKPCAVRHEKESRCGMGRSPRSSPHIPIAFCSSGPFAATRPPGFEPQQLLTGRCSRTGSAAWEGGREKPCFQKSGHADAQGRWQDGTNRNGNKKPKHQRFLQQKSHSE